MKVVATHRSLIAGLAFLVVVAASIRSAPVAVTAVDAARTVRVAASVFAKKKMREVSSGQRSEFHALRAATDAIPRGGGGVLGTAVTSENLVAFWIAICGALGALFASPQKHSDVFGWKPAPKISPGSLVELTLESNASACFGLAVMLYLSNFRGGMDAPTIVAYGSLAQGYIVYKTFLNDVYVKLGSRKGFDAFQVALFAGYYVLVLGGKSDVNTSLLAKLFCIPPTVVGVLGCFDPDAAKKLVGIKEKFDPVSGLDDL
jgi:hypothetical protein